MPRPKSLLATLLVACVAFALVEGFVRACLPRPEYFAGYPFDPGLGFTGVPGMRLQCCDERGAFPWVLNATGTRGPDLPERGERAPSGTQRLLFVGDSFLQGWEVRDETLLPNSAQATLAERGIPAQSFSLSTTGHGTAQELLVLRRHGARVRPDAVVLCLYSGNDVVDNSLDLAGLTAVSAGAWVRPYFALDEAGELELTWLHPWRARLRRHSHFLTLLDYHDYHWRYHAYGQYMRVDEDRPFDPIQRLAKGLVMAADMELFLEPEPGGDWERAWRTTEALLVAFDRDVRALGARFMVVVIPHVAQVESNAVFRQMDAFMLASGQASMLEQLDLALPERRLRALLERHGIPGVFLLEELRAATRASGTSAFAHDGHFNGRGHALAGALVGARLAELLTGGAPGVTAAVSEGAPANIPVDILASVWAERAELRFSEPHADVFGLGWLGWGCNRFGLGPGWAMNQEGWLVLPRGQRYVLEAELPRAAGFPVEFQVNDDLQAYAEPLTVTAPGPFELRLDTSAAGTGPEWMPVRVQASRTFPSLQGAPVGMILKAVRRSL